MPRKKVFNSLMPVVFWLGEKKSFVSLDLQIRRTNPVEIKFDTAEDVYSFAMGLISQAESYWPDTLDRYLVNKADKLIVDPVVYASKKIN